MRSAKLILQYLALRDISFFSLIMFLTVVIHETTNFGTSTFLKNMLYKNFYQEDLLINEMSTKQSVFRNLVVNLKNYANSPDSY